MNKAGKNKLLYIIGISLMFYFIGCIDTSVTNIPESIDFHSQIQIVNLASLNGAATIDVLNKDGKMEATTGSLTVGSAFPADGQAFMDIPSGTKTFKVTFANNSTASFKLAITTERKIRLFLINPDSSSTDLIRSDQRYTFQQKNSDNAGNLYPADSASIAFFNGSLDASVAAVSVNGEDIDASSIDPGKSTPYMLFKAADYTIAFKDTANLATASISAKSKGRYTAVLFGTKGNLQAKVYTDD